MHIHPLMKQCKSITGFICLLQAVLLAGWVFAAPGDLVIQRKEGVVSSGFPNSIFPHWKHRINYRCDACHTHLFEMQAGKAEISMADINAGESCGTCHNGGRAFAVDFTNCNRCHVPEEAE